MKCLIVDDDRSCRDLIAQSLSGSDSTTAVATGAEALVEFGDALSAGQPFDLVLVDDDLADADVATLLGEFRGLEDRHGRDLHPSAEAVLLLSGRAALDWPRLATLGPVTVLEKPAPVDLHELQAIVIARRTTGLAPRRAVASGVEQRHRVSSIDTAGTAAGGGLRFLVVDDDRVCRELLCDILRAYGEVDLAIDGREAVRAFRLALEDGRPYDLVTLDIMMPDMDGHAALQAIRQLEEQFGILGSAGVRVVMTTALRDSKHCVTAFREGCEAYVTKPIDEEQLLARLRELEVPVG